MNKRVLSICGILLILIGVLWIGQGLDIIGGSSMSGSNMWAIIGVFSVIAGAFMTYRARGNDVQ